jgi:uncharacterized ParB-like nuclease family protein
MKKLLLILALLFSTTLFAMETEHSTETSTAVENEDDDLALEEEEEELFEKVGFLTTEDCALKGTFTSCYSESYACNFEGCFEENDAGETTPIQIVLFVHNDGKFYKVNLGSVAKSEADKGLGRNEVTVIGKYDEATNTIVASEFKAPPPPKASFFKGCL